MLHLTMLFREASGIEGGRRAHRACTAGRAPWRIMMHHHARTRDQDARRSCTISAGYVT